MDSRGLQSTPAIERPKLSAAKGRRHEVQILETLENAHARLSGTSRGESPAFNSRRPPSLASFLVWIVSAWLLGAVQAFATESSPISSVALALERNVGQMENPAPFLARSLGTTIAVYPNGLILPIRDRVVRLSIDGMGEPLRIRTEGEDAGVANYFLPRGTFTAIPRHERLVTAFSSGGVLSFHGFQGELEYDIHLRRASEAASLRFRFAGADAVCLRLDGSLAIEVGGAVLYQRPPAAYQEKGGIKRSIPVTFLMTGRNEVAVDLEAPDPAAPVLIDPVLDYGTYYGGGRNDAAYALAVDQIGNVYIAGYTSSLNFPTVAPYQAGCGSCGPSSADAFVTKLAPDGQTVIYSTFLGGSGMDAAYALAVDRFEDVYIAGGTDSNDYPVTKAIQPSRRGGFDAFITKLKPAGDGLVYSTYLGGSNDDIAYGLAVTDGKAPLIGGITFSTDFPMANPVQSSSGGPPDAFLTKLESTGLAFLHSSYLGGPGPDEIRSIALDGYRRPYVAGTIDGAVLLRLNHPGTVIEYALVSPVPDSAGQAVTVQSDGTAFLAADEPGCTYPERGILVLKVAPDSTIARQDQFASCDGTSEIHSITDDGHGRVYLAGGSTSRAFLECPSGHSYAGADMDAFILELDKNGSVDEMTTLLGGSMIDRAFGIALAPQGGVFLAGESRSDDLPAPGAIQPALANSPGKRDAFVARLLPEPASAPPGADFEAAPRTGSPPLAVQFQDRTQCHVKSRLWSFGDGTFSTRRNPLHTYTTEGIYTISLTTTNGAGSETETKSDLVTVGLPIQADFHAEPLEGAAPLDVAFQNDTTGAATSFLWDFGDGATSTAINPTHRYFGIGSFSVSLTAFTPYTHNAVTRDSYVRIHEVWPDFDASPRIVRPGQSVAFFDQSRGPVTGRTFLFGDGSSSGSSSPTHLYSQTGYFAVTLKLTGPTSQEALTRTDYVLVSHLPADEILAAPGPSHDSPPYVLGYDVLGTRLASTSLLAYPGARYGATVGAGDIDADGFDEILTGPGPALPNGPRVRAFARDSKPLPRIDFFAYGSLHYGVRATSGLIRPGSPRALLTEAGPGPPFGPHVRGFDASGGRVRALRQVNFFAYQTLQYGVHLAAADLDATGLDVVITAPGPGPSFAPHIRAFDLDAAPAALPGIDFYAFADPRFGGKPAASAMTGLPSQQILVATGPGAALASRIRAFDASHGVTLIPQGEFEPYPGDHYGAEPAGGELNGDGTGEILTARGPDPAAAADIRGFRYGAIGDPIPSTIVTSIPSLGFQAFDWSYGAHVTAAKLGY